METLIDTTNSMSLANTIKRGIIYARCSSIKQIMDHNTSLETQVSICLEYCANNEIFVIEIFKNVVPGHEIEKMDIYNIPNNFSNVHIILADPSRLSRNVSDADMFLKKCDEKNIVIHFARDNLMSNILHDRRNIIGLIHDAYTETQIMSKRIKSSINLRKRKGSFIGNPEFGNKIIKTCDSNENENENEHKHEQIQIRKKVLDENEQKIIQIIKDLYYGTKKTKVVETLIRKLGSDKKYKLLWKNGDPVKKIYYGNISTPYISVTLNENNILKRGKLWTPSSVLTVLNNLPPSELENSINYIKPISASNGFLFEDC